MGELAHAVPTLAVQITTEAEGLYTPTEQRQMVRALRPAMVSVSVKEMLSYDDKAAALDFCSSCRDQDIALQHILYSTADLDRLLALKFTDDNAQILFVLGSYQGEPSDTRIYRYLACLRRIAAWDSLARTA